MEAPQITSHPECGSQCNGKASASGHNPGNWNISYHEDKPFKGQGVREFNVVIIFVSRLTFIKATDKMIPISLQFTTRAFIVEKDVQIGEEVFFFC